MSHTTRRRIVAVAFFALLATAVLRVRRGGTTPAFAPPDQPAPADDPQPPWTGPVAAPADAPPLHDPPT